MNVTQELKVEIEGIRQRIPPSHYEDKDKELINKLQKDNDHLRKTLEALNSRLRESTEERDSLILTVKILSKYLYFNSKKTCAPSSLPPVLSPDANGSGNNNNRGKRQKKKKSRLTQVDVIPETAEISENKIVEQQLQQPPTEVSIILGDSIVQRVHGPSLSKKSRS